MQERLKRRRIFELDLLRGFLICVIILDHLQFWPSPFQYLTGQGRLWASAAEGFFLISGLLVGYLRAYKGANTPLKSLSKLLLRRAATLYIWFVVITLFLVSVSVLLPNNITDLLPRAPETEQTSSLLAYIWSVVTLGFGSDWIYFLRLYAIMLALTPVFLWLVRRGLWWVAALTSFGLYAGSLVFGWDEGALQWQLLFFSAALLGWQLEAIIDWFAKHLVLRKVFLITIVSVFVVSYCISYFLTHGWSYVESPSPHYLTRDTYVAIKADVDPLFSNYPMMPLRIVVSWIWFVGLLGLFHVLKPWIMRWVGWLLLPFGQASLTAYCLQALLLPFVVATLQLNGNFWVNGLASAAILLMFVWLIKQPIITRVLPR